MSKQTDAVKLGGNGMHRPMPESGNAGEKTHDLKPLDAEKLDNPALVSSVEDRLAALRDITGPVKTGRKNPAAEEDEPEVVDDDPVEPEEKADGEVTPDESDAPTRDEGVRQQQEAGERGLPEAYKRCAVAYGWKESDVDEFFKSDPERALTTLSNIYQTRNKASAEFAAIGRKHAAESVKPVEQPAFKPVDVAKLREQYGEDAGPLIEMLEAQNKTMQMLAEQLPREAKKPDKPFASAVEESGVEQQVYNFFESDRMKPYDKVYGKLGMGEVWDDLHPGQREHRWKVLEKADQIAGGARLQGIQMTLDEALEAAHLLVTQKYRDQILVDGVKANVVKRAKGITLQPSKGTKKPGDEQDKPGTRSREQLVDSTQRKLSKLFG